MTFKQEEICIVRNHSYNNFKYKQRQRSKSQGHKQTSLYNKINKRELVGTYVVYF